ncbi:CaiB/BaiF CoA transferase family protein [Frankia gtarii]|uniref:CaiB/BaiF CoA transferase family protein n=1 Tax=Frankia gtarii TaxID=2950102 RepID=UPI0021BE8F11|nr:CoA transferase [Frankia gtarii]
MTVMAGIRVLEVASWTFVPAAGAVLADWGAQVIKVEHPGRGDPQRALTYGRHAATPVRFMAETPNRGKRSIGLDISTPGGREILYRLAASCDVFLTNFLPSARARLKIDVEDIRQHRPDVVYARGSGQGPAGPEADAPGFDGTSYWARSGLAHSLTPDTLEESLQATPALGDLQAGLVLAGGIGTALFQRSRSGGSVEVDMSLLGAGLWALGSSISGSGVLGGADLRPVPRAENRNPLSLAYATKDRRYVKLSMLESDRYWADLCQHLDAPELIDDSRFADSAARGENSAACVACLDDAFARRSLAEWVERLRTVRGPWAVVQTPAEVLDDPQVVANGYVRTVHDADGHELPLVASPLQFDNRSPELERAPRHGEHTDEVLLELGLSWDEIINGKIDGSVM